MQPESSEFYPTASTTSNTEEQHTTNQHGLGSPVTNVPPSQAADAAESGTDAESIVRPAQVISLFGSSSDTPAPHPGSRLSPAPGTPLPSNSAANRIVEYEKSSASPMRKSEGPVFEVIKKQRNPADKRSPLQELPNEVLTHILAHLSPTDLTAVASVSKRFHDLVTGPHAWRSAFAHYFPGPDSVDADSWNDINNSDAPLRTEKRAFTRLTPLASWRSEYVMRTRLLRSLARGKPAQAVAGAGTPRSGQSPSVVPITMYNSQLFTTINHIHGTFTGSANKRLPRFIHGADDMGCATSSDPLATRVDPWGLSDPQTFLQFSERFVGDAEYGLGPGEVVGVPNVMDVSQPFGLIHGEGSPGGMVYFRSTEELRGRFLAFSSAMRTPALGIPRISSANESITSVWIAKSASIPALTEGLIGMLTGSSLGVVTAYSLGSTGNVFNRESRFGRGETTARWVLSPGVPIIAFAIDNEYSLKRYAQNRIWAVALNALGELFYLTKFPKRPHVERGMQMDNESLERSAWTSGRTAFWNAVDPSRRTARPDPYADTRVDGSYTPRSSWNGMCLTEHQIIAETKEIEDFVERKPYHFQKTCIGWDMRRRLEADFAGDDGNHAGENFVVIECGLNEDSAASLKRYARCRFHDRFLSGTTSTPPLTAGSTQASNPPSVFGGNSPVGAPVSTFALDNLADSLSQDQFMDTLTPRPLSEEWRITEFSLRGLKHVQILASAIDQSNIAVHTISEDPLLSFFGPSTASSPSLTPMSPSDGIASPADVPGQRARLFAVGTQTGSILLWNIRAPLPRTADISNLTEPIRIIYTESPQISCLALSSLYLVHGGSDGLVQAWDPLGSTSQPIRTLNSRFASRARRRLVQAQASPQGVGINLFAAGSICLDPDPTALRGLVSLGTQLRYWSYSSSAADQYKSQKRRLRRSERGSNNGGERFAGAGRSNLKDYIASERFELDRERDMRQKEAQRFAGRFGTELLDGSEEEMIAYAAMLSQETLEQENKRRGSHTDTAVSSSGHDSPEMTPADSPSARLSTPKTDEELEADVAEAIRQSLATSPGHAFDVPIRPAKVKGRKGSSARPSPGPSPSLQGSSKAAEMNDLEFALQLSLAEEQSRQTAAEEFPALSTPILQGSKADGKGKRRVA